MTDDEVEQFNTDNRMLVRELSRLVRKLKSPGVRADLQAFIDSRKITIAQVGSYSADVDYAKYMQE